MKKSLFSLMLISSFLHTSQEGMLVKFMKETNDTLPLPSTEALASSAALVTVATLGGAVTLQKKSIDNADLSITRGPQTRSVSLSLGSALLSSPVIWTTFGACAVAFAVNYFIGREMSIIISTKGTLKALEKQITLWQTELPKLKENQETIALKVKNALHILDTITPLVVKLAKNSEQENTSAQVIAIQKELTNLKKLVLALTNAPDDSSAEETGKAIEKKSHSIFGFCKKN